MVQTELTDGADSWGRARTLAKLCLAATVCAPLVTLTGEATRRAKAAFDDASFVVLTSPSTAPADLTAGLVVTSPTASVARFSILPLPIIAAVVDARGVREVLISRIGGLYGPCAPDPLCSHSSTARA
jgi:hypothetical protein